MADLVIACLSQKGGVGKSTLARLIARTYAAAGWAVKIADFNTRQLSSADWCALRMSSGIEPHIGIEIMRSTKGLKRDPSDLIVIDGAPDSDNTSLEAARAATMIVLPTGATVDDLKPQIGFANELVSKGVPRSKVIFVFNRIIEGESALKDATQLLKVAGFEVAETAIFSKKGYAVAQNQGFAISESAYPTLSERAEMLATELVTKVNNETGMAAA